VWASVEHPELWLGPPRSGKGFSLVINGIMAAPGPVIASSVRSDNMVATIKGRAARGPVAVFDPERVSGRESTFRWSPLAGCEDPRVAQRRAQVLVAGTGISRGENAVWGSTAGGILQALLHAAALDGRSVHDLWRWAQSPAHMGEAARVLENQSAENWEAQLDAIKSADPRLQGSQFLGVKEAMRPLDLEAVRDAFDVPADQATDIGRFLADCGTLYPLARWSGEDTDTPSTGRYITLLFDEFVSTARELSQTSGLNRLDPPLTIVADELANMHPWSNLGQAFAAGSGEGVKVCAVFQSLSQIRAGWGLDVADTLWNAANVVILGGNKNPADLDAIARLVGERVVSQTHDTWSEMGGPWRRGGAEQLTFRPVLTADDIRRIPQGCGLLVAGSCRPVLVDLEPWPERPWSWLVRESEVWHMSHPARGGALAPAYTGQ
jgi:type IV secretory pathway TraG/TraD family ATPase VirD4